MGWRRKRRTEASSNGNDERRCRVFIKLQKFKYVIIIMFSNNMYRGCVCGCVRGVVREISRKSQGGGKEEWEDKWRRHCLSLWLLILITGPQVGPDFWHTSRNLAHLYLPPTLIRSPPPPPPPNSVTFVRNVNFPPLIGM